MSTQPAPEAGLEEQGEHAALRISSPAEASKAQLPGLKNAQSCPSHPAELC